MSNKVFVILLLIFAVFKVKTTCSQVAIFGSNPLASFKPRDKFTIIDTVITLIIYELQVVNDTASPKNINNDVLWVEIGNRITKSYSRNRIIYDSLTKIEIEKLGVYHSLDEETPPCEVYKNYPPEKISVSYLTPQTGIYLYTEENIVFDWQIHNETKSISNLPCQKASTTFRGRTWEAWFTFKIPIPEGPYKFGGLPGLIIQIQDDRKDYVFSFSSIQHPKKDTPIKFWTWKYETTTREKLNAMLKSIHENMVPYINNLGLDWYDKSPGNKLKKISSYKVPYNPIELE